MRCFCDDQETTDLKIEGDLGADAIWCTECGCNFDMADIPISDVLKKELGDWMMAYGDWFDWGKDRLLPNGIKLEEAHNEQGRRLTEKVRKELDGKYKVIFSAATIARNYASDKE